MVPERTGRFIASPRQTEVDLSGNSERAGRDRTSLIHRTFNLNAFHADSGLPWKAALRIFEIVGGTTFLSALETWRTDFESARSAMLFSRNSSSLSLIAFRIVSSSSTTEGQNQYWSREETRPFALGLRFRCRTLRRRPTSFIMRSKETGRVPACSFVSVMSTARGFESMPIVSYPSALANRGAVPEPHMGSRNMDSWRPSGNSRRTEPAISPNIFAGYG